MRCLTGLPCLAPAARPARISGRCPNRGCRRHPLDLDAVRQLPLFEALAPDVAATFFQRAVIEVFPRGALLFEAGAMVEAFFIVLSGRVKLFALNADGKESVVEIVEPVSSFAEAAMFAGQFYPVAAEVVEKAALVRVDAGHFLSRLRRHPELAVRMLGALSRWEGRLERELAQIKGCTSATRVAEFLLSLTSAASGAAVVDLPLKKALIASRLGMEPESLSRVLGRLREVGVETSGRTVRIGDVGRLRALCAAPAPAAPAAPE